jgi:hypothetical protein
MVVAEPTLTPAIRFPERCPELPTTHVKSLGETSIFLEVRPSSTSRVRSRVWDEQKEKKQEKKKSKGINRNNRPDFSKVVMGSKISSTSFCS